MLEFGGHENVPITGPGGELMKDWDVPGAPVLRGGHGKDPITGPGGLTDEGLIHGSGRRETLVPGAPVLLGGQGK